MTVTQTPRTSPARRILDAVMGLLATVSAVAMIVMMLHTVANAVMRSLFNQPLVGANEQAASWYLPVVVFLGFIFAQERGKHIVVDLVADNLRSPRRELALRLAWFTTAGMCALLAQGTWVEAQHSQDIGLTAGVMGVVIWPFTFLPPFAFAVMTLQLLVMVVRPVAPKADIDPEEMIS